MLPLRCGSPQRGACRSCLVLRLRTRTPAFAEPQANGHTGRRSPHPVTSSMLKFSVRGVCVAVAVVRRLKTSATTTLRSTLLCCALAAQPALAIAAPPVAELGAPGAALLADSAHQRLFASLPASEQVAVIDARTLAVSGRISLPGQARGLALRSNSGELLVALSNGRGFAVVEPVSLAVTHYEFSLPAGVTGFDQLADMGQGRVLLYSAAAPGYFAVFDSAAPRTLLWTTTTIAHQAQSLEFDQARQRLYSTSGGQFVVLDFTTPNAPVVLIHSAQLSDGSPLAARGLAQMRFDVANQRVVSGDGLIFDPITLVPWRDLPGARHSVLSADGRYLFTNADDGRLQRRGVRDAADDRALSLGCVDSEVTSLAVLADGASAVALAGAQVCGTLGPGQRHGIRAAAVAATVPSPLELYPSHRNAKWTYKKISDGALESGTIVGSSTIDKHPAWKTLYADKTYSFRQVTADEASEVRSVFPVDLQTVTSVPPNILVKKTDQIGKSYVQTGYFTAVQGSGTPRKINYRETRKIIGYSNVKLSFGTFRALRIDYNIVQSFQGETRTSDGTSWLVPGLGEAQLGAKGKPTTKLSDVTVDFDKDRVNAKTDNCLLVKNANQLDTDRDKSGNDCDKDDDGDGVADSADNCPLIKNATQTDTDNDRTGDSCETP